MWVENVACVRGVVRRSPAELEQELADLEEEVRRVTQLKASAVESEDFKAAQSAKDMLEAARVAATAVRAELKICAGSEEDSLRQAGRNAEALKEQLVGLET